MKISSLQHGSPVALKVSPESGKPPKAAAVGREVRLVFTNTAKETILCLDREERLTVLPVDDGSRRQLSAIRRTDPPRLCWIAAQNADFITLSVHKFRSGTWLPESIELGIDELVVERICKEQNRRLEPEGVCRWLTEKILLPPLDGQPLFRAIATGSPGADSRFRLLGDRVGVDIVPREGTLCVERVVGLRGGGQGFRPPEFLLEADLAFIDATAAGKMRPGIRCQLDQIVKDSSSYLALWMKYQRLEGDSIVRRARRLGWLAYGVCETRPDGLWKFTVSDRKAFNDFRSRLGEWDKLTLEADSNPPPELLEGAVPEEGTEKRGRVRIATGTLENIRDNRRELLVRPLDEDCDVVPPKKGVLFTGMHGDRSRLFRRDNAVKRLQSADARIPQLGLILEDRPTPVIRRDKVPSSTRAIRKVFDHEPTPAQRQAIHIAMNTPDIAVIQGPPGTGKTKVITAIQAGLAELESDSPGIGGRTLLTSFQHDAVDHAAEKTRVYGLPPMRVGGRRGAAPADGILQRWALDTREEIQAKLSEFPEERPLSEYRMFRDRVAAYASGRMSEKETRSLLDALIALTAGTLPTALWERLRRLRQKGGSFPADSVDLDRELMVKFARGIRTTSTAFADDGPRKARQALRHLDALLDEADRDLLEASARVPAGGSFDRLDALGKLKDRLVDRLIPADVPGDLCRTDPETVQVLNAAVAALHERLKGNRGSVPDVLAEYAETLLKDPAGMERMLQHYAAVYAATCQQSVGYHMVESKGGEIDNTVFDNIIVDEAARANPLDLFIPMSLARRRIILVGDQRQLPHLLEPDVEQELSQSASEATREALRQSLFQKLFDDLAERERRDGIPRVITLDQQFRMHPTLGRFVSDVFYKPESGFHSPRLAEEFHHAIPGYLRADRPVCAAWKDIPHREGPERSGRSKARPAEARWIAGEVRRLLEDQGSEMSIGVITFYRAQVDSLLEALQAEGVAGRDPETGALAILSRWRTLPREDGQREERIRVDTVDAFQGKEFDVVFLSVTRSNKFRSKMEKDLARKYGHLRLPNRLCVAMSRQKRLLVAVGDREMFTAEAAREAVPGLYKFLELCGGNDGLLT